MILATTNRIPTARAIAEQDACRLIARLCADEGFRSALAKSVQGTPVVRALSEMPRCPRPGCRALLTTGYAPYCPECANDALIIALAGQGGEDWI